MDEVTDIIPPEIDHETHATTGGAAAAGAITGGVIGLTAGPITAALGAVGGALVGVAAERLMHGDDGGDDLDRE
jgi:outer membrane lipoprotein SlyB